MKNLLKNCAYIFSIVVVMPVVIIYKLLMALKRSEKTFQGFSQLLSLIPGIIGEYLRKAFYRFALNKCPQDCCISFGTIFSHSTAEIGKGVYIGPNCSLGDVILGDDILLGSGVDIMNGSEQHGFDRLDIPIREQGGKFPKVYIGEDTWIGNGAAITANVGKKCIIGTRSVVIKEIEDYSIAVGQPARIIKKRK